MARPNVSTTLTDEGLLVSGTESGSPFIAAVIDPDSAPHNLLNALGNTAERQNGLMTISSVGEWNERLTSTHPTGIGPYNTPISSIKSTTRGFFPFVHRDPASLIEVGGDFYAGSTFNYQRWPSGSQYSPWDYMWNFINNYLSYGGIIKIFGAKSSESIGDVITRAKNKRESVDAFLSPFFSKNNDVRGIVDVRGDCIAVTSVPSENQAGIIQRTGSDTHTEPVIPASNDFFRGGTWSYPGYAARSNQHISRFTFDKAFFGNSGSVYQYDHGKLVYSVVMRKDKPGPTAGTTTDVVNFERYRVLHEMDHSFGTRGWTADLNTAAAIGVGVTLGLTTDAIGPNGLLRFESPDVPGRVFSKIPGPQGSNVGRTEAEALAWKSQLSGSAGVTIYQNTQVRSGLGDILIIDGMVNLRDSFMEKILKTEPNIVPFPANGEDTAPFNVLFSYQNFFHLAVPANWMDPFTYTFPEPANLADGSNPVNKTDTSASSALAFGGGAGGGSRSFEHIPDPTLSGQRVFTGTPEDAYDGLAGGEFPRISNSEARTSLIDMRQTLNPDFDILDNLYGTNGTFPNAKLHAAFTKQRIKEGNISNPLAPGSSYDTQAHATKQLYNVFGITGASLDVANSQGKKPLDFWGCTCANLPEMLYTFNLVGATPDICVETSVPGITRRGVTASGSTYNAYIGWSEPYPKMIMKNLVNIFGETIGTSAVPGSTLGLFHDKYLNTVAEDKTYNDRQSTASVVLPTRSFVFYPLVVNDAFNSEAAVGPGNFPLKRDTSNYFYLAEPQTEGFQSLAQVKIPFMRRWDAENDVNLVKYRDYYQEDYDSSSIDDTPIALSNIANRLRNSNINIFPANTLLNDGVGATLPGTFGKVGNPGISYENLFYAGHSAESGYTGDGFGGDGIYLVAEVDIVPGIPTAAFSPSDAQFDIEDYTLDNIFSSTSDKFEFAVFGEKFSQSTNKVLNTQDEVNQLSNAVEIPLTSDVGGMFARQFRDLQPWFSPANRSVSTVKDIISERYGLTDGQQDTLYDAKVNFMRNSDGSLRLFGDKTLAPATSTFSRVNVSNLFIYLKKKLEPLSRKFLFEQNDAQSRKLFLNSALPFLQTVQGSRGISEFKVICDETNNTPDIVDSNQFVVDIFVKPVKTINFIKIRFTNVGTSFELE